MQTFSGLGTLTWETPRFFISYDNQTGRIMAIGEAKEGMPSFEVEFKDVEMFLTGKEVTHNYAVCKDGDKMTVTKTANPHLVCKSYPVPLVDSYFPKAKITRNVSKKVWIIEKISNDPIFVFVCNYGSKRNYIRTLRITETGEYPFVYESESQDISLYVKENNSEIKYCDE